MITKLLLALKKWALPILVIYVLALTIGSLAHLNGMPSLGFSFEDKIRHFIAYFLFTVLVYNYCKARNLTNAIPKAILSVIIYGIIIELLQKVMTSYRTLDVYDVLANSLGAVLAALIIIVRKKLKLK
nr:VanZ family protein [uncultured Psychroserpens sp.]